MLTAWYERAGPACKVLQVGHTPDPEPDDGEVRIRLTRSGSRQTQRHERSQRRGTTQGALSPPIAELIPLERIAEAND